MSVRVRGSAVAVSAMPRHAGKALAPARASVAVFRAELVPPLADAMRLVDRDQRDRLPLQPLDACRG